MTDPSHRRNFLRGQFARGQGPLRPPWALGEAAFLERCTRCGDCARACPTGIIVMCDSGYPAVDFQRGECRFCGDCVTVCAPGALQRDAERPPWTIRARLGESCLAARRIECRVCGEQCDAQAIRFPPRAGGPPLPEIDVSRCAGCGACIAPCPVGALRAQAP